MPDEEILCSDCGKTFPFTQAEKDFYNEKGFVTPKRCPECRKKKKRMSKGDRPRQTYDVICNECGIETKVPFKPKDGLPVYCKDCFVKKKGEKGPATAPSSSPRAPKVTAASEDTTEDKEDPATSEHEDVEGEGSVDEDEDETMEEDDE
jgi:CxxC-x17-CxxC domain-containing protein